MKRDIKGNWVVGEGVIYGAIFDSKLFETERHFEFQTINIGVGLWWYQVKTCLLLYRNNKRF